MSIAEPPIVIAHRGASGDVPEHTLAAYAVAIEMGADFIEPDLVMTKDGVLIARHDCDLGDTTDVGDRPEFALRRRTLAIDGVLRRGGWFAHDFTLDEIRRLRCRERLVEVRPANRRFDGVFPIPTLDEVLDLAAAANVRFERATGAGARPRKVGVYPEIKHPSHHAKLGLPMARPLLDALARSGFGGADAPLFLQSFEPSSLRSLAGETPAPLIQLVAASGRPADCADGGGRDFADLVSDEGLAFVAGYAAGIGVDKALAIPRTSSGGMAAPTTLIARAGRAGLLVHAWTFRAENAFLPVEARVGDPAAAGYQALRGDLERELESFFAAGVDGVFADQPDVAVRARDAFLSRTAARG